MKLKSKDVQKQSLWLLVLFAVFFAAVVFNSDWKTDVHEHADSNAMFKYHKPESTLKNAINHYTVIHFLQYAAVSFVKVIQLWQVVIFSVFGKFSSFTRILNGVESPGSTSSLILFLISQVFNSAE